MEQEFRHLGILHIHLAGLVDSLVDDPAALRAPELRGRFEEQGLLVQSMGLTESRSFV